MSIDIAPAPTPASPAPTKAAVVSAPISSQVLGPEYPLSSFSSTPHNVACIGFLLGVTWCIGVSRVLPLLFGDSKWLLWSRSVLDDASELLPAQGIVNALKSPVLGMYIACWAVFHLLEFVVTSMWNPGKLSVASFLLDNGQAYHIAHAFGILEHVLEDAYLPPSWRKFKHAGALVVFGWGLVIGGQILRSFAMITASSNFSHVVAFKKLETHKLVKTGIYAWSRHPSYAGFVWWAMGTQVMLANPIGCLGFSLALYSFFSNRIRVEEKLLVKFFGDDYIDYRAKVPTRILFIR